MTIFDKCETLKPTTRSCLVQVANRGNGIETLFSTYNYTPESLYKDMLKYATVDDVIRFIYGNRSEPTHKGVWHRVVRLDEECDFISSLVFTEHHPTGFRPGEAKYELCKECVQPKIMLFGVDTCEDCIIIKLENYHDW